MIDIVPDKKVVKINATVDDDINLILDAVTKVDAAYVMLVIPEGNDLITSPIGLKALRRKTLEKGKRMVLVVPAGDSLEITKKAGFMATTTVESVTSDVWQTVSTQYDEYYHQQVGMNSKKPVQSMDSRVEYMNPVSKDIPVPEIISGGGRQVTPPSQDAEGADTDGSQSDNSTSSSVNHPDRVPHQNVTGMDFAKLVKMGKQAPPLPRPQGQVTISPATEVNTFNPDILPKKVGMNIAKVQKKRETSVATKITGGIIAVIVLFIVALFAVYYIFFPTLRIDAFIQAEALNLSDTAVATSAITGFDVNKKEVQLTREKSEQNGTRTFAATETGVDGTKATGTVQFSNSDTVAKSFPAGTLVISGSLRFVTTAVISIPAHSGGSDGAATATLTASNVGEEYNVPVGTKPFLIGTETKVTGEALSAFLGGTKRTFPIVGQKDVDQATKDLQAQLEQQAVSELTDMDKDKGYAFIPSSVKTEIKDKATVTPAVGTEVKATDVQPTISMFTTTTALYYQKDSVTKLAEKLLLEKYRIEKSLSDADMATTTIEDLSVEIGTVAVDKTEKVTVAFKATGLATTKIDVEAFRASIAGKKWPQMLEVASQLPALQKQPVVSFNPSWIPSFARYVPKEPSRIDVHITSVTPSDSATPSDSPTPSATVKP